jgi:hypothetical protein
MTRYVVGFQGKGWIEAKDPDDAVDGMQKAFDGIDLLDVDVDFREPEPVG